MNINKSSGIETELGSTNQRVIELQTQLNEQTATFEATQTAFVGGKASIDELHAEQQKLTLITQAIESLETAASELQTAFDEAVEAESLKTLLESAKQTALEAETLFGESVEIREEFDKIIAEFAEKLCDKFYAFRIAKKKYARLRGQFEGKIPGVSDEILILLERNYEALPPLRFGAVISNVADWVGEQRYRAELRRKRASAQE